MLQFAESYSSKRDAELFEPKEFRKLSLTDRLEEGDVFTSSELSTFQPISSNLAGLRVSEIDIHFDKETFKGFFRKTERQCVENQK